MTFSETILFTGFPGFIGKKLIRRLLKERESAFFYLLVLPSMKDAAVKELKDVTSGDEKLLSRFKIIESDISEKNLALSSDLYSKIKSEVTEAYHLAAIYHLGVPKKIAYKVNVDGTKNMLDILDGAPNFKKLIYYSTCFVAGYRDGIVKEEELNHSTGFKNYYEETKHYAEILVRERMSKVPSVIIRPSIVIGDSETGEITKFDGPYYIIRLLAKMPSFARVPGLGKMKAFVNVVPVDYVVNSTLALAKDDSALGKTFHISDPDPLTTEEMFKTFAGHFGIKMLPFNIPDKFAVSLLKKIPKFGDIVGLPPELFDYFNHKVVFDVSNAKKHLSKVNVNCPSLRDYHPVIVKYCLDNPEISLAKKTSDNK